MRLVSKKTFLSLPENTLYLKLHKSEVLCIKGKSLENHGEYTDWYVQNTCEIECSGSDEYNDILCKAEDDENFSFELNLHLEGRDGLFEDEEQFLVYEKKDVIELIERLKECL